MWAMAHLLVLVVVNSLTLLGLAILLIRAGYSLAINTTMIESWEIERHEALVDRTRRSGGYTYANGGQRMRIEHQEFPYDIGIWKNMCQAMGTNNVLAWFMPFGGSPHIRGAAEWEVNDFEDESKTWPPPDPDKMPRTEHRGDEQNLPEYSTPQEEVAAFKKRQQKDHKRWTKLSESDEDGEEEEEEEEYEEGIDGEAGWTNSDGDRLRDYGVDEEAEIVADDEIPLGELLRRRKGKASIVSN
jgi:palmitoyltransferase